MVVILNDDYDKDHCWQYDIRLKRKRLDLAMNGITDGEVSSLRVPDFTFDAYDLKEDPWIKKQARYFIEKYEWLGKMSQYPSHIFTARYEGILCGVVVFDMPIAFSALLGSNTRDIERLISRGACISFSPKGLPSSFTNLILELNPRSKGRWKSSTISPGPNSKGPKKLTA